MKKLQKIIIYMTKDPLGTLGWLVIVFFGLTAIFASHIVPYDPNVRNYENGKLIRLEPPSSEHLFGTTYYGQDVLSQTIMGTQVSVLVGLVSAFGTTVVGTIVGLVAGYYGKWVDDVLMRITDVAYGTPVLGCAIILVAVLGPSVWNVILVISMLLWRTTARSIRAQTLTLKERPFIWAAKAAGASPFRIMFVHIFPSVASLSFFYAALGVGGAVLSESGISFLGLGDPLRTSWGQMLYFAFITASIRRAWWWVVAPGVCISLFVMASYFVGRSFDKIFNPKLSAGW